MNIRIPQSGKAAKSAKAFLQSQGLDVSNQQCLELVARLHGYGDWQAMNADTRFSDKPVLKPLSSTEYELDPKSDTVRIVVQNICVLIHMNANGQIEEAGPGVRVDLAPKDDDDSDARCGAWLSFADAVPNAEGAVEQVWIQYDKQRDTWYWCAEAASSLATESALAPTFQGKRDKDWGGPFMGHEDLIEALENIERKLILEVNWVRSDAPTVAVCNVFQYNGEYIEGIPLAQALKSAKTMRDAGAPGTWTVETEDGELIAIFN